MKRYRYTAVSRRGEQFVDEIDARGSAEVIEHLKAKKLRLINLKIIHEDTATKKLTLIEEFRDFFELLMEKYYAEKGLQKEKVKTDDQTLLLFTQQLATILGAGLSITGGLRSILISEPNRSFRKVIQGLIEYLEGGCSTYQAFSKYPGVFPSSYLGLLKVGENAGILPEVLERQARDLQKLYSFKKKVMSGLSYPAVVLVFAIISVIFIMVYFVPNFISIYKEVDIQLPFITVILITIVHYTSNPLFWVLLISFILVNYIIFRRSIKTISGKYMFDLFKLKIPYIGEIIKNNNFYIIFLNFACMLEAGVLLKDALSTLKGVSHNVIYAGLIDEMLATINEGGTLSDVLKQKFYLPRFVVDLIEVGEISGELPPMVRKAAELMEEQALLRVEALLKFIEPAVIVLLAFFMGFIMLAIFLPLYNVLNTFAA